jgi:hypothetical protein
MGDRFCRSRAGAVALARFVEDINRNLEDGGEIQ